MLFDYIFMTLAFSQNNWQFQSRFTDNYVFHGENTMRIFTECQSKTPSPSLLNSIDGLYLRANLRTCTTTAS